ncbi:MAG: nitroreductase family protein, partial [Pseudomonadota bacterium]
MDVSTAVDRRISTRGFLDKAIPKDEIAKWLTDAQRSPSGGNTQPWKVIVVAGDERQAIIDMAQKVLADAAATGLVGLPKILGIYWSIGRLARRVLGKDFL